MTQRHRVGDLVVDRAVVEMRRTQVRPKSPKKSHLKKERILALERAVRDDAHGVLTGTPVFTGGERGAASSARF